MFDETNQFPWKLHILLEEAERNQDAHAIVSWLPEGDAFKVHNKVEFGDVIMPKYFNSSKHKSFQRNLNLWGFQTLTKNPNKGAIFHPDFLRGKPDQCKLMKRIRVKKITPKMSLVEFQTAMRAKTKMASPSSPAVSNAKVAPATQKTSALKVPPSTAVLAAEQDRIWHQHQGQKHDQTWVQNIAQLSSSTTPTAQLLQNMLFPCAPINPLIQAAQQQEHPSRTQAQMPSVLAASPRLNQGATVDRLKDQLYWALLVTNTPTCTRDLGWPLLSREQTAPFPGPNENA